MSGRQMVADLPPPHDLDAERAVLGAALLAAEAFDVAASVVRAEDFYRDAHRRIFQSMADLRAQGGALDFIVLRDRLRSRGVLDEVGGPAYLASLTDGLPVGSHVEAHAGIVREKARLRALVAAAGRLMTAATACEEPASRIAEALSHELSACVGAAGPGLVTELGAIQQYVSAIASESGLSVLTGYLDLDALIGGFHGGDLVIVAARPSVGKSSFALGLALHLATNGKPALFCSLEMSVKALASRLLAWRSGVPSARLERGTATTEEYARMSDVYQQESGPPLYIEAHARTVTEIAAWAQRVRRESGLGCIIVDYLQLLSPGRRRDSDESEIAEAVKDLKRLSVDLDVPVVALSQLNRAPETRRDKRPHVSDLRGSGVIEQACDIALLLFREEMYRPKPENAGIAEVIVGKNRNGPVGVVRLLFRKELAQFLNLEME